MCYINNKHMKNIISKSVFSLLIVTSLLSVSCKKEPITPGNYKTVQIPKDTTNWQNTYGNGGVIPNNNGGTTLNDLVGTTWVLTRMMSGFANSYPNDTIRFTDNTHYTINNGAVRNYLLTSSVASTNKTMSLYYFYPFGGSHYSGEVGGMFVSDGRIDNVEFMNIQNTTDKLKAWFIKI